MVETVGVVCLFKCCFGNEATVWVRPLTQAQAVTQVIEQKAAPFVLLLKNGGDGGSRTHVQSVLQGVSTSVDSN